MKRASRLTGVTGAVLALVGVWGAWVPHRDAALVLSGWDLAEYLKFVPGANVPRDLFYLPVWCGAITLLILANPPANLRPGLSPVRLGLIAVALGLMVALLPPYPDTLTGFRTAGYRWRFIFGASGIVLALLSLRVRRWPARLAGGALLVLAGLGAFPALWQFIQVRNELETVYGARLGWGWGVGALLVGWALVGAVGGRLLFRARTSQ